MSRVGGVRVTDIVGSRFELLDLFGVSITISLVYNSSHTFNSFRITNPSLLSGSCTGL
jgi:hypothetical protein